MKKRITLDDIASRLGVSRTLVSLVLNGRGDEKGISCKTQKKVLALANELNYQPNHFALGLRLGSSKTLGLVVADISNLFFSRIARSVEDAASAHGYQVIFTSSDENEEKEIKLIRMLKKRQVDGLIIASTLSDKEEIKKLKKEKYPFILIDRYCPNIKTNYVVSDNYSGAYKMAEHLIKSGYRRIGLLRISPAHITSVNDREKGFRCALNKYDLRIDRRLIREIPYGRIEQCMEKEIRELINPPLCAQALFFLNNNLTVAGLDILNKYGFRIPQDVAVVSFDDIPLFKFHYPPITAVNQPVEEMGRKAVEILLDQINRKANRQGEEQFKLPAEILIRNSCNHFISLDQ